MDKLSVNDELGRMRTEMVIACFVVLSQHFTERTNVRNMDDRTAGRESKWKPSESEPEE